MTGKNKHYIELKIPNDPDYIHLARLVISGIGNKLDFDFEEIRKMKFSISEMCKFICRHCDEENIDIRFKISSKKLTFSFNNNCPHKRKELEKYITAFNIDFYMDKINFGKKISLSKKLPKRA